MTRRTRVLVALAAGAAVWLSPSTANAPSTVRPSVDAATNALPPR